MTKMPRLLNSSLSEVRRLRPVSVTISESIVPLNTASMVLEAGETVPERGWVELFTPNGSAGIFRAGVPQEAYGSPTNTIDLEHGLCEIGDFIVKAEIEAVTKTLSQAVAQVFTYYAGSRWQIGTVVSGNVTLETNYGDNLLTCINGLVAQIPSAMISCNFSTSPWTLNIVSRGTTVAAEGRLSRNVVSASVQRDDKDLCTRVYMEGLGSSGAIGYMDADTISTYGVIEKKISGSEDYTLAQAQAVATSYLNKYKQPKYTVTISAVDLSRITGESLDQVQIGKKYRLAIPDDGVTIEENIVKISWANVYDSKGQVELTLSQEENNLVTFLQETSSAIEGTNSLLKYMDKEYMTKFEMTDQTIELYAARTDKANTILEKAGLSINAQGVIVYAENSQPGDNFLQSKITSLSSRIDVQADRISLVVTGEGNNKTVNRAAIVAAINEDASSTVSISADKIDLQGHVSISDLEEWTTSTSGAMLTVNGSIDALGVYAMYGAFTSDLSFSYGGHSYSLYVQDIEINGTHYNVVLGSGITPN